MPLPRTAQTGPARETWADWRRTSVVDTTVGGDGTGIHASSRPTPARPALGRQSDLLSEAGAQHFLGMVPHARYVDVADAGHMVVGDRNDAFSGAVLDFVAEVHDTPVIGESVA